MASQDDLVDAKITAETRTDTKIARMEGKLDLVIDKISNLREDNKHLHNNTFAVGISLAILIIGVAAIAPVIFDLGMRARETISREIQERFLTRQPIHTDHYA